MDKLARAQLWVAAVAIFAIVMGSISFGFATPTEAGALGALGAVLIAIVSGTFTLGGLYSALKQSALSFTAIFVTIIGGALLTHYAAVAGLNQVLGEIFNQSAAGPLTLVLAVTLFYIILGMFIDSIGLLLLTASLILPIAVSLDMDMIWFGIILIKLLEIGLITPPVGLNIFASDAAKCVCSYIQANLVLSFRTFEPSLNPFSRALKDHVEDGNNNHAQNSGREHSTKNGDTDGLLASSPCPTGE